MARGVFLDRDGTIIFDAHYLSDPALVKLLPNAAQALALLRDAGFLLFLFTNQSGVGRGLFPLEAVYRCNDRMLELLDLGPTLFAEVCIATESPEQPVVYRKPSPRFINEAVARHHLDRSRSWMVGDKPADAESGLNAGIQAAFLGPAPCAAGATVACHDSLYSFAQAVVAREN